jgi:hypothetical protein
MLLGRKLLKNMLTQIDSVSRRGSTSMCCARNKRFHRHTLIDCMPAYAASASTIHVGFMPLTRNQNAGRSIERNTKYSNTALTLRRTSSFSSDESL